MDESMKKRLEATRERYKQLEEALSQDDIASDLANLAKISKEKASLEQPTKLYEEYLTLEADVAESYEMEAIGDAEIIELAKETRKSDLARMEQIEEQLKLLLLPTDPNDNKNIIVEIRGAVGGDEANIFAGDLLRMYTKYAEKQGWKIKLLDASLLSFSTMKIQLSAK